MKRATTTLTCTDSRPLPERRCGDQAALAGAEEHHGRLEPIHQGVERGDEPVRHRLRRSIRKDVLRAVDCSCRNGRAPRDRPLWQELLKAPQTQKFRHARPDRAASGIRGCSAPSFILPTLPSGISFELHPEYPRPISCGHQAIVHTLSRPPPGFASTAHHSILLQSLP